MSDLFDGIRSAAARVAERSRHVRIDEAGLSALCRRLAAEPEPQPASDPVQQPFADPAHTLAFVVTLDAINFGSGWFPHLRKPGGRSGYFTIATALRARFEAQGPWSSAALQQLTPQQCARVFGQEARSCGESGPVDQLMALYARALQDLGRFLDARFDGRFEGLVAAAAGRASALVLLLAEMPFYRDVSRYAGFDVLFYKRAQITVSDLANAFGGEGPGRFEDRARLTMFADNLVPHVLRLEGALACREELVERIEAEQEIPAGSQEEVELRACGLHAVERCVAELRSLGVEASAESLDHRLWFRGQRPEFKARPRHRTRSVYY
ncbi:MAG TPA: queuosine salvage family protein [Myxococcota bacterium]|nr:queuosine salvage family protein [Myxococcota bacterium]